MQQKNNKNKPIHKIFENLKFPDNNFDDFAKKLSTKQTQNSQQSMSSNDKEKKYFTETENIRKFEILEIFKMCI